MKQLFFNRSVLMITACTLFSAFSARGQWSGTNPLTTPSNVNIKSPGNDASLDVGGSGDSATVQITTPWMMMSGYVGPLRIRGTNTIMYGPPTWLTVTNYYPLFCVGSNGYLGLRTETPSEMIHLNGGNILVHNGSIRIRNASGTNNFKVDQNGLLVARQVDVHLDPIPDYVFHAAFNTDSAAHYNKTGTYKAMSLKEIDTYVQENKHLPGIKSAAEYQECGSINVGELQLKLLEKIEELTLYNIDLMKQVEELRQQQSATEQLLRR